jgi:hypothetical protein
MEKNYGILELGIFYEQFVRRAYDEFLISPVDPFRAKVAASHADIMAERVWNACKDSDRTKVGNAQSARAYRQFLVANECADFQLVWDVHDGHKHVDLSRSNRQITSAAQTGIVQRGGAFDANALQADAFDVGQSEIVVILDDGTERAIAEVLKNVIDMWERLLETRLR